MYLIDLQRFAEDNESETLSQSQNENETTKEDKKEEVKEESKAKYTDEDLDRIINKKFEKWQKGKEKEVNEAKKLAQMNEREKAEYERDELKKELEEFKNKEKLSEMKKTAREILEEKNIHISDNLLSMFVSIDAENTKNAVEDFSKMFQSMVEEEVTKRLKGNTPKVGVGSSITKEDILKIKDRNLRQQKIRENMNLFEKEK